MFENDMLTPILIYLALPFSGLVLFALLVLKMYKEKIRNKPIAELFVVFLSYGGLIVFMLTTLFWYWSVLALIGLLYLAFIAPILHVIICIYLRKEIKSSLFHKRIYQSLLFYFIIAPLIFCALYLKN